MQNLLLILRLIWSPKSLARVAIQVSNIWAISISAVVIALEIALIFAAGISGLDEPYKDFGAYFFEYVVLSIKFTVGFSICFAPWVIVFTVKFKDLYRSRRAAESRTIILAPLCFLIPLLIFSISTIFAQVHDSGFGLGKAAPDWTKFPLFKFFGSIWWLPILFVVGIIFCERAVRQVKQIFPGSDNPNCEECGYLLKGLPERRCPECGLRF